MIASDYNWRDEQPIPETNGGAAPEPAWDPSIDALGDKLDGAALSAVGTMTLSELVDNAGSAASDGHLVDKD